MTNNASFPSLVTVRFDRAVSDLRDQLQTVSQDAVTGTHSDLVGHLRGKVGEAMLAQKALDGIESDRNRLELRSTRLSLTQSALDRVSEGVDKIGAQALSALGLDDQAGLKGAATAAASALEEIVSTLNVRHAGRYLFSGDATATPPLAPASNLLADIQAIAQAAPTPDAFAADLDTYFTAPDGGWRQTIYGGTPNATDPDSVTASTPAIVDMISGLAVLALGAQDQTSDTVLDSVVVEAAAKRVIGGQTELVSIQAEVGLKQAEIARDLESLDIEQTLFNQSLNSLIGRDPFEAASKLRELENNLEAAYAITARLSNLNLLNFIR